MTNWPIGVVLGCAVHGGRIKWQRVHIHLMEAVKGKERPRDECPTVMSEDASPWPKTHSVTVNLLDTSNPLQRACHGLTPPALEVPPLQSLCHFPGAPSQRPSLGHKGPLGTLLDPNDSSTCFSWAPQSLGPSLLPCFTVLGLKLFSWDCIP